MMRSGFCLTNSCNIQKPKKVKETDESLSFSFSKSASLKKQKKKSVSGLAKVSASFFATSCQIVRECGHTHGI